MQWILTTATSVSSFSLCVCARAFGVAMNAYSRLSIVAGRAYKGIEIGNETLHINQATEITLIASARLYVCMLAWASHGLLTHHLAGADGRDRRRCHRALLIRLPPVLVCQFLRDCFGRLASTRVWTWSDLPQRSRNDHCIAHKTRFHASYLLLLDAAMWPTIAIASTLLCVGLATRS